MTDRPSVAAVGSDPDPTASSNPADDPLCQCQGCGVWRSVGWIGKAHACWRAEDGTYEEGGTFQ